MFKPLQLATAAACGLSVPPTLVANAPKAVGRSATEYADTGVICKSFGSNAVTEGGQLKVAYTHRLTGDDLADLRSVASTATQVQHIDRTTGRHADVVGQRMFTILITAHSDQAAVDWRADFDALTYQWIETPLEIEKSLRAYMDTLGLAYAAFDFGIEQDTERFMFYESNSSGQYRWLEAQTGAPITAALADLLTEGAAA